MSADEASLLENASAAFFLGLDQLLFGKRSGEESLPEDEWALRDKLPINSWTSTGGLVSKLIQDFDQQVVPGDVLTHTQPYSSASSSSSSSSSHERGPLRSFANMAPISHRSQLSKNVRSIESNPLTPSLALAPEFEATLGIAPNISKKARARLSKASKPDTAGKQWFDLPAQEMTPELQAELQVLALRGYMYKDRFYKKSLDLKKPPKHFQMGTVIAGAAEKYRSGNKKHAKKSLVDQLLEDSARRKWTEKKYLEIQAAKNPGSRPKYSKYKKQRTAKN